VQVVLAGVGYPNVQTRDLFFLFSPVAGIFLFPGQPALSPGQLFLQLAEAVQRCVDRAVREGGEAGDAQIDSRRGRDGRHWLGYLPLSLDGREPMPTPAGDSEILECPQDITAFAETNPADLGKIHSVALDLETLGIAKTVMLPLFPKPGHPFGLLEAVPQGPVQVFEDLLLYLGMGLFQKAVFFAPLPEFQETRQVLVAQERYLAFQPALLKSQGLVPDEPAMTREEPEQPFVFRIGL